MTFGERLVELRKENGYKNRTDLANKLNIPSTTLRNYENDSREPGHSFLVVISNFFNVSIDYLLGITEDKERSSLFSVKDSEMNIIKKYRQLNSHGKEVVNLVLDAELKNSLKIEKVVYLNAAHERTDIEATEEMRKHDDDIMMDPDF